MKYLVDWTYSDSVLRLSQYVDLKQIFGGWNGVTKPQTPKKFGFFPKPPAPLTI